MKKKKPNPRIHHQGFRKGLVELESFFLGYWIYYVVKEFALQAVKYDVVSEKQAPRYWRFKNDHLL